MLYCYVLLLHYVFTNNTTGLASVTCAHMQTTTTPYSRTVMPTAFSQLDSIIVQQFTATSHV